DVTPEAIDRCRRAGAHAFLAKPVAATRLLDVLADIAARPGRRTLEAAAVESRPRPGAEGPFDPGVLDELASLELGAEFEREFIGNCLADAAACLGAMRSAGEADDWERMREQAHALKGVAANTGLVGLA